MKLLRREGNEFLDRLLGRIEAIEELFGFEAAGLLKIPLGEVGRLDRLHTFYRRMCEATIGEYELDRPEN